MRKFLVLFFSGFLLSISMSTAHAFVSGDITVNTSDVLYVHQGQLDIMGGDLNFSSDFAGETMTAFTVQQVGTAGISAVESIHLWRDMGEAGFQGRGVDEYLSTGYWISETSSWVFSDLNSIIPKEGARFFITFHTPLSYSKIQDESIQFQIPRFSEIDTNGIYDRSKLFETGIFGSDFMRGPTNAIISLNQSIISAQNGDFLPPRAVITSITQGELLNDSTVSISGHVQDQAGQSISRVRIGVAYENNVYSYQDAVITEIGRNDYEFKTTIKLEKEGSYNIVIEAYDANQNEFRSKPLTVIYKKVFSDAPVTIEYNVEKNVFIHNIYPQNGYLSGIMYDSNKKFIPNKEFEITLSRGAFIFSDKIKTNEKGSFVYVIDSQRFQSEGVVMGDITILFTIPNHTANIRIEGNNTLSLLVTELSGILIKSVSHPAVYLLKDNKRYTFPNQSVFKSYFKDFSSVKTISELELATYPLVGNITYRPGLLIKIPSIPKVYYISDFGRITWIKTEEEARRLFGDTWGKQIYDVSEAYFLDYKSEN